MTDIISFLFVALIAAFILVPIAAIGLMLLALPLVFVFSVVVRLAGGK